MSENRVSLPGLRPTLRHWLIVVVLFALASAILAPVVHQATPAHLTNAALATLLLSPWALAVLILALDRPGPVKFWAAPLLFVSFSPLLALCYDALVLVNYLNYGVKPNPGVCLFVNLVFHGAFVVYLAYMGPTSCPGCGRRALIPWMTLWGRVRRFSKTRWCACCGARYWRNAGESWKPDRRAS
jgi:hypothetical protein